MITTHPCASAEVLVPTGAGSSPATLVLPENATALVILTRGSGGPRTAPQNAVVAGALQRAGIATLEIELLRGAEVGEPDYLFDARETGRRLGDVLRWAGSQPALRALPIGLFASGTSASAALVACAAPGCPVRALVACAGHPEFAGGTAGGVRVPGLFLAGGYDWAILDLNEEAVERLGPPSEMRVIPGATHYFEEDGAVDQVAALAREWYLRWLAGAQGDVKARA